MRVRLVPVAEVKCNFCLDWIQAPSNTASSIFVCLPCLHRLSHGALTLDSSGQPHRLTLSPIPHSDDSSDPCSIQNSRIEPLSRQPSILSQKFIDSGYSTKENNAHLRNNLSLPDILRKQSESLADISNLLVKKLPSEKQTWDDSSDRPSSKICSEEFNETVRKDGKYQFYYLPSQINRFKREEGDHPIERLFETDTKEGYSNNQLFLGLNRTRRLTMRSHRSNPPSQACETALKMRQEVVRQKVDAYLEIRCQSTSLQRILAANVRQAYDQTSFQGKSVELVSFNAEALDLGCYLSLLDGETVATLKLISLGLSNEHLTPVLEWVGRKRVERLVLTCNRLSDECLIVLLGRALPDLKEIYLGRNRINKFRMKEHILALRSKFILYL